MVICCASTRRSARAAGGPTEAAKVAAQGAFRPKRGQGKGTIALCRIAGLAVAAVLLSGAVEESLRRVRSTRWPGYRSALRLFDRGGRLTPLCQWPRAPLANLAFVHRMLRAHAQSTGPLRSFRLAWWRNWIGRRCHSAVTLNGGIRLHESRSFVLRHRVVPALEPRTRAQLLSASAHVLAGEGHLQKQRSSAIEAESVGGLASLVRAQAPALVDQCRAATLEAALRRLATSWIDQDPWLGLWQAVCELPRDPAQAEEGARRGVEQFRAKGDEVGSSWPWQCAIQAIVCTGRRLWPAVVACRPRRPCERALPPAIEARVRASSLWRSPFSSPAAPLPSAPPMRQWLSLWLRPRWPTPPYLRQRAYDLWRREKAARHRIRSS